jgi:hypothetical protein
VSSARPWKSLRPWSPPAIALVVSAGGRLVQPLLDSGAEHLTLDIGRKSLLTLRHLPTLRRLFAEVGADIVHARSRLPAWLGLYAIRAMPAAQRPHWVTTVHGLNSPSRYSAVMTSGERVICVSNTVRDYVQRHYPTVPEEAAGDSARRRCRPSSRAWRVPTVARGWRWRPIILAGAG